MLAICQSGVSTDQQALNTSSKVEKKVSQGKKPRAKSGIKRKQSSKHTFDSKIEASKSKTSQSTKETQSSLAKDTNPNHPSASTHVVDEMHKEAHQAARCSTSLGAISEKEAHPQLSSADFTIEA
ncbi:hypothetical protein Tco_0278802 [Tanacetum coccineum]